MNIINALFFAVLFFAVAYGIIMVGLISLYGIFRSFHIKNYRDMAVHFCVFTFIYTGTSSVLDSITENGVQSEIGITEQEEYITQWLFPDDRIAIERADNSSSEGNVFYVLLERNAHVYEVEVFEEVAFGLFRYDLKSYSQDERYSSSVKETP